MTSTFHPQSLSKALEPKNIIYIFSGAKMVVESLNTDMFTKGKVVPVLT
jgi:hypothetical protein